eukprot:COSAG02_NODE_1522_length_12158_cov_23.675263_8_plen_52_part_00
MYHVTLVAGGAFVATAEGTSDKPQVNAKTGVAHVYAFKAKVGVTYRIEAPK